MWNPFFGEPSTAYKQVVYIFPNFCRIIIIINIMIFFFTPGEFLNPAIAGDLALESTWQQVS